MTRTYNATLVESNSSVSYFNTWGAWIHAALATAGLSCVYQSATWGSVAVPTAATTYVLTEVWAFTDSLQSTLPVYIQIKYGSGTGVNYPGLTLQVGTGTDGSGNLSGVTSAVTALTGDAVNTTGLPSFISGDTNRVCGMLWVTGSLMVFAIERTHDSSGSDTSDGIQVWCGSARSNLFYYQYISATAAGTQFTHWNAALPPSGTGVNGSNVAIYPVRGWNPGETTASKQIFIYFTADITAYSAPTVTGWDGSSVTVYANGQASYSNTFYGGTGYIAMRYD
nr:hypothetical protein [uncultured Holophaga sp.]